MYIYLEYYTLLQQNCGRFDGASKMRCTAHRNIIYSFGHVTRILYREIKFHNLSVGFLTLNFRDL